MQGTGKPFGSFFKYKYIYLSIISFASWHPFPFQNSHSGFPLNYLDDCISCLYNVPFVGIDPWAVS